MINGKYDKEVQVLCPTCGENNYFVLEGLDKLTELVKCVHCERTITKDELLRENSEKFMNNFRI